MERIGGMQKGSKAKVRDSWGIYDAYKYIRKNHWLGIGKSVTEKDFYAIIRGINRLIAEDIANGRIVKFPSRMGKLELRKYQRGVSIVDGKLKNTYPIDWHNTLLLWENNEEARKQKIRLRHENEWVYHIRYNKWDATYENKMFYQFAVNTFIKRALAKNIKQGKVDTLW
jgi:hypothetical protein